MLLRPSELARFWELHPKTVYLWIKGGRLRAVKTPGDHYRVRAEDIPAFCDASGLPLPPQVAGAGRRATLLGGAPSALRTIRRVLKARGVVATPYASALEGLLASATAPPSLLVLDAGALDAENAVRALRRTKATRSVPIFVHGAPSAARAEALLRAGADWAVVKERALAEALEAAVA
jgi:two-component system, OmpR family, response regulator VicR